MDLSLQLFINLHELCSTPLDPILQLCVQAREVFICVLQFQGILLLRLNRFKERIVLLLQHHRHVIECLAHLADLIF